jgi:hypothetical protein
MSNPRRFGLDELTIRPGTYFNPQTEVLIVVDDSPEVDHEIFGEEEFESNEWVLISEETPLDETQRDDLIEQFRIAYPAGAASGLSEDEELDDEEDDELDELELEVE